MVYLFPPKVIRTETNMDIEAKSKIKMFYFLSLTWRLIGEWRDRSGLISEFTVQMPPRTRENTKIFLKRTCDILSNSSPFQSAHESAGYEGQEN